MAANRALVDYKRAEGVAASFMNCTPAKMGLTHRYLEAFKAADKDGSGTLTRDELQGVLVARGIPESEIDNLMNQLDLNGDGIISLGEYKIALGISTQPLDAWRQLFDELDENKSGTIDVEELENFLKEANMQSLIPVLEDWVADYDVNKDGKLQYSEFLGFIASLED